MFLLRMSSILVMIFTFFQNGETVKPSSSRTNDNIAVQYNNLMRIDTGYSHEDLSNAQVTESTITDVKAIIYNSLLCSFVFTCRHFIQLINVLVKEKSEDFLKVVFSYIFDEPPGRRIIEEAPDFQYQVVKMFFVLKHLGPLNSLDPLWLMYAYLECFKTVLSGNIRESDVVNHDYDFVNRLLIQFTDNKCPPDNIYNNQYGKSEYFNQLQTVNLNDENSLKYMFDYIIDSTEHRFGKIRQILSLNYDTVFFQTNSLRLPTITLNNYVIITLVRYFVEINLEYAEDEPEIYTRIKKYCFEYRESNPPHLLFVGIGECLRMYDSLMKYIIAQNVMKYILDVHSTLPDIGNQPMMVRAKWILRSNIMRTNGMMLNYIKDIVSFLKTDDDEELKFFAGIFDSEKHVAFTDPEKNIENENKIKNILEKCKRILYNNAPSTVVSRADLVLPYRSNRREELLTLARLHDIKVSDLYGFSYDGMLDLFVFKSFIDILFDSRHLDVAHSFFKFSENFYSAFSFNA